MATLWSGWKLCKWIILSLFVIYLLLFSAVQINQWIIRRQAEHLLSDLRGLQLEKSSLSNTQALMHRWGKWGRYACNKDHCDYEIQFDPIEIVTGPIVYSERFNRFASRAAEMAVKVLNAHLPCVEGGFRLQNNVVSETWFSLATNTPAGGQIISRVRGTRTRDLEPYDLWPEKDPHPEYRTVLRSGTLGYFFTQFTATTRPEDVEWLTDVNFSCITRWVPCKEMGDLLPTAWARDMAENETVFAIRRRIAECDYPLEDLVKAAERVAVVRVEEPNIQKREWSPYPARLVQSLKGSGSWHLGDARAIWSGLDPIAPTEILLFEDDSDPVYPHYCGVLPATPENLQAVKAAVLSSH